MSARISSERLAPAGARARPSAPAARADFHGARTLGRVARLDPRDAGGILDLAFEGLFARLGPCLAVALCVWLPFAGVQEVFGLSGLDQLTLQFTTLGYQLLVLVPTGITTSVVASLVADALAEPDAPVMPGLLRGLRRAPGVVVVLAASTLVTMLTGIVLFFLCGLGVFVGQWLTFVAAPLYALEEDAPARAPRGRRRSDQPGPFGRVLQALSRSIQLARGGPSFGRWILVAFVGYYLFAFALESSGSALNFPQAREFVQAKLGLGGRLSGLLFGSIAAASTAFGTCVRAAIMTAFYLDLRVRREGLDLFVRLEQGERAVPAAP